MNAHRLLFATALRFLGAWYFVPAAVTLIGGAFEDALPKRIGVEQGLNLLFALAYVLFAGRIAGFVFAGPPARDARTSASFLGLAVVAAVALREAVLTLAGELAGPLYLVDGVPFPGEPLSAYAGVIISGMLFAIVGWTVPAVWTRRAARARGAEPASAVRDAAIGAPALVALALWVVGIAWLARLGADLLRTAFVDDPMGVGIPWGRVIVLTTLATGIATALLFARAWSGVLLHAGDERSWRWDARTGDVRALGLRTVGWLSAYRALVFATHPEPWHDGAAAVLPALLAVVLLGDARRVAAWMRGIAFAKPAFEAGERLDVPALRAHVLALLAGFGVAYGLGHALPVRDEAWTASFVALAVAGLAVLATGRPRRMLLLAGPALRDVFGAVLIHMGAWRATFGHRGFLEWLGDNVHALVYVGAGLAWMTPSLWGRVPPGAALRRQSEGVA